MYPKIFEYIIIFKKANESYYYRQISDILKKRNGHEMGIFFAVIEEEDESGFGWNSHLMCANAHPYM